MRLPLLTGLSAEELVGRTDVVRFALGVVRVVILLGAVVTLRPLLMPVRILVGPLAIVMPSLPARSHNDSAGVPG